MHESMTVAVGLDVHARSIRLAAVRADELLEERTLPYDEEAVERLLRRWPVVRCCYEAGKLARLLAGGLLQPIHVPSPELEAARDLVRAREDARLDRMRDRQRLSKFCLRQGRLLPTTAWTVMRRRWLS